jgi:CheY-like chemotaxis protein
MISTDRVCDQALAYAAGANAYLVKPVRPDRLLRTSGC